MSNKRPDDRPQILSFPALPVLGQMSAESEEGDSKPTVLITGASGKIGQALAAAWADLYDLILLDANPLPNSNIEEAHLERWEEEWLGYFDEADVVVHLAAHTDPTAAWPEMIESNLDVVNHVFLATALSGIDRLIFASSHRVMAGYQETNQPITPGLPPLPEGAAGASKLAGERLGKALAESQGLTFIALRIGHVQDAQDLPADPWKRGLWLSGTDMVHIFTRSVEADLEPGTNLVVNAMSDNRGSRWPIDAARTELGYQPVDDAFRLSAP